MHKIFSFGAAERNENLNIYKTKARKVGGFSAALAIHTCANDGETF
jgi:hypothetical protein